MSLKKYKIIILLVLIIAILAIVKFVLFVPKQELPQVVSTSPQKDSSQVVSTLSKIEIVFDKPITEEGRLQIVPFPPINFEKQFDAHKTTLTLLLKEPLKKGTRYTLEVFLLPERLLVYSWSFETEKEPVGRGDPELPKKIIEYTQKNYPLSSFIPYKTDEFEIDYLGPAKLEIVLKGKDKEKAKVEALEWIRSKGVDPESHEIVYAEE